MPFTSSEIRAAAARAQPKAPGYDLGTGKVPIEAELRKILAEASEALTADSDTALYLLWLLRKRLLKHLDTALTQLGTIQKAVTECKAQGRPVAPDTSALTDLQGHLQVLALETQAQQARRVTLVSRSIDTVVSSLGACQGGDVLLQRDEAYAQVKPALESLAEAYAEVLALQEQFDRLLGEYAEIHLPALQAQAERGAELAGELQGELLAPERHARSSTASLLALKGLLRSKSGTADPLQDKLEAEAEAAGTSTKAEILGTELAPFVIPPATVLDLVVDGTPFSWTLPTASIGQVQSKTLSPVQIDVGINDQVSLEVDGVTIAVTLTPGPAQTPAQIAADLVGQGLLATESGGVITVVSPTLGSAGWVRVLLGTANATLGWGEGHSGRGTDVSVSDLRDSLQDLGGLFALRDRLVTHPDSGPAAADGTQTLVLSSVPEGVEAGDTLEVLDEPGRGAYWVQGTTTTTITVDRVVPTGSYLVRLYRQSLRLESKLATAASALEVEDSAGASLLGLPVGEVRGQVRELRFSALPLTKPPLRPRDRVFFAGLEASLREIRSDTLVLDIPFDNDFSGPVTVAPLGAALYPECVDALVVARDRLRTGSFASGLKPLTDAILGALSRGAKGLALDRVEELEALLEGFQAAVTPYDAVVIPAVEQVQAALREHRLDRAEDLFLSGQLETFFSLTAGEASYRARAQQSLGSAVSEFPLPEDVSPEEVFASDSGAEQAERLENETLEEPPYLVDDDDGEEFVSY